MENKKVKISYIISSSEIGGTEKMLLLMLENLNLNLFKKPIVFAIKGEGKFTDELIRRNIKTYIFNFKKKPYTFCLFLRYLKKETPDIIHSFLFVGNLVGRVAGLFLKNCLVISSQRSIDVWRKWYHWQIDKFTSIWADLIISNSYSGKDVLTKKAHIPKEKIIVIPNGISNDKLQCTIKRESFGLKKSDYLVGTVGNLKIAKGHIYLIKGAEKVLKEFPNTFFLIAGEGPLKNSLLQEIGKRGMTKNFIFTGFRSDIEELIQLFDIFVLPSLWEGFPVSLLEAMKYGKPTVSFGVADIPYIIENNISGFVVEPKNYVELAEKIIMLLKDKNIRHQTGVSAKIRVEENFGLEKMLSDYTSVYVETLKKRLH